MRVPNAAQEPLRRVRPEYANQEESNKYSGEPQFDQPQPKRPRNARPRLRCVHFYDRGVFGI